MQPFTQQGGIPLHTRGQNYHSGAANNWGRRFPGHQHRVAHAQRQNVQNVNPHPRRIQDHKPRPRPPKTVQNSRPPLGLLRNGSHNGFHPSFNVPPRFLRGPGPVNVIPYAQPLRWTSIPTIDNLLPLSQQNLSSGLSNHGSECSEDVDLPDPLDLEVQGLVTTFLEKLESDGGLEMALNFLLNQDVSNSRATFHLASTISLILRSQTNPQSGLRENIRVMALLRFVEHWKPGGYWQIEAIMPVTRPFNGIARKGMSISSFIAALFIARVVSADDLQDCLYALIAHPVHFDRLCAMHAMVTHANLRLCKAKYWLRTRAFRDRLVAVNLQNRAFTWAQDGPSSFFVVDIIATLDRWHCTAVMNDMRRATNFLPLSMLSS